MMKGLYSVSLYAEPLQEAARILAVLQRIAMLTGTGPVRLENVGETEAIYSFRLFSDNPEEEAERVRLAVDEGLALASIAPLRLESISEEDK